MATFSRVILWENAALKLGGSLGFDTLTPTQDRQSIDHSSNCGENVHFQWKEAKQTAVFSFFSHLNPIWVKSETSLWPKTPISERFIQNMMLPNCHCNKWGNLKCPFFYGLFLSVFYTRAYIYLTAQYSIKNGETAKLSSTLFCSLQFMRWLLELSSFRLPEVKLAFGESYLTRCKIYSFLSGSTCLVPLHAI